VRITLLPLDVGFDVRVHGMPVHIPAGVDEVDYLDGEGKERTARGDSRSIVKELESFGYSAVYVGDPV